MPAPRIVVRGTVTRPSPGDRANHIRMLAGAVPEFTDHFLAVYTSVLAVACRYGLNAASGQISAGGSRCSTEQASEDQVIRGVDDSVTVEIGVVIIGA